jgi:hypothetical protein
VTVDLCCVFALKNKFANTTPSRQLMTIQNYLLFIKPTQEAF